ncbi:cation efflux protein [Tricharina praecox]|uniref:cation efflux protein n=1 Tax=Tricharina praecox TaxID=43433 RepID=UPI00221E98B8|nr:cation efflux protein [Tricharina praecox]KAI5846864.1 cation efflux protein [Tricharina praecox]
MGLSRSSRIITLLVIDTIFFFLEIIVGYAVHSLALVADSFHMLNDVFSLIVALWAIKLAKAKSSNDYTYGWQRAEVLGALINGVFLLALCLSIFLEAVQRFFEPQEIQNPWLILAVGSAGLASNIVGLFLFHDHGHSHGGEAAEGHGHSHSHDDIEAHGDDTSLYDEEDDLRRDEGDIESVLPGNVVRRVAEASPIMSSSSRGKQTYFASPITDIHVHPAMNRQEVFNAAASEASESAVSDNDEQDEHTPLMTDGGKTVPAGGRRRGDSRTWHRDHNHSKPKKAGKGGHSHQNLNMRGVFLHVLGDALGNVGVILTALFVKYSPNHEWSRPFTNYADPTISLIITIIIFSSALPLVKSASKILLQGVPKGIALDEVKEDIRSIPGIESVHELHIWQLSDVKMIASLHIQIAFDPETDKGLKYMRLAKAVRTCLHAVGVHSVTIQPEYTPKGGLAAIASQAGTSTYGALGTAATDADACLLECGDECGSGKCCAPVDENAVGNGAHGHSH